LLLIVGNKLDLNQETCFTINAPQIFFIIDAIATICVALTKMAKAINALGKVTSFLTKTISSVKTALGHEHW
jgi:hypothetical protein